MSINQLDLDMENIVIIEDVNCWMDGGTITLKMKKNESLFYDVEFVQKVSLTNREKLPLPGSLLLNNEEIEIRSELETEILSEIKVAELGGKILSREKELLKKIISEAVEFVESEEYIRVAKKVGRIK
jgi:hypothetical protein